MEPLEKMGLRERVVVREVCCGREDFSGMATGSGLVVAAVAEGLVAGGASGLLLDEALASRPGLIGPNRPRDRFTERPTQTRLPQLQGQAPRGGTSAQTPKSKPPQKSQSTAHTKPLATDRCLNNAGEEKRFSSQRLR